MTQNTLIDIFCDMPKMSEETLRKALCFSSIYEMSDVEVLLLVSHWLSKKPSVDSIALVLSLVILAQSSLSIDYSDLEAKFLFVEDSRFLESIKIYLPILKENKARGSLLNLSLLIKSLTKSWFELNPSKEDRDIIYDLVKFVDLPDSVNDHFYRSSQSFEAGLPSASSKEVTDSVRGLKRLASNTTGSFLERAQSIVSSIEWQEYLSRHSTKSFNNMTSS